jgi:hypothetical protein
MKTMGNMYVIALEGKPNSGKTETINIVYQLMLQIGYRQIENNVKDLGPKDFLDVLTNDIQTVGIVSHGDYAIGKYSVKTHLAKLEGFGCDKVICACTIGESKGRIKTAIEKYPHTYVLKSFQPAVELQRIDNNTDANKLMSYL